MSEALSFCHWHQHIPYRTVVCTATLIGCYRITHWNHRKRVLDYLGEINDDGLGDYSIGRYCWELTNVEVCDPAIPVKGAQGWWTWDHPHRPADVTAIA